MSAYQIPAAPFRYEQVIKKSRFITIIAHASDEVAARAVIQAARQEFPDAGHACYAFVAGQPGNTTNLSCSDDGEPSGTAGKPMLNVLLHGEVAEIVAVVVRYFGGIKLGTGGLVRAYSSSVSEAMKILPTREFVELTRLQIQLPYALEGHARRLLESASAQHLESDYGENLILNCQLPEEEIAALRTTLQDMSKGQATFYFPDSPERD